MTIDPSLPSSHIDLSTFTSAARAAEEAAAGGDAILVVSGTQVKVLGTGVTPSGRSVAWVAPDDDTMRMFADALARSFGNGIASAVTRELGLDRAGPLSAGTVNRALDMAQTSRHALDGVDFALRLSCLATTGSDAFNDACIQVGVDPASLTHAQRHAIDDAMRERFEQAAEQGQSPVSPDTARAWLRELVQS